MNPGPGVPSFLLVVLGESVRRIRQLFPLKIIKTVTGCSWISKLVKLVPEMYIPFHAFRRLVK